MIKKIKILGHEIEIAELPIDYDQTYMGGSRVAKSKIWIAKDMPISVQEETLIHEVIEHINTNCDLHIEHPAISTLAAILYQVLKDNFIWEEK